MTEQRLPETTAASLFEGLQAIDAKRWGEAAIALRHAVSLDGSQASAHYYLGTALAALGDPQGAADAFRSALAIEPTMAPAHNNLGLALRDMGRLEEAVRAFEQALVRDPNDVLAHNNLGVTLWELGLHEDALEAHRNALEIKRNYATVYNNLGAALRDQGRLAEAIAMFRQARRLDHGNAYIPKNQGLALLAVGQRPTARRALRRALHLIEAQLQETSVALGPRLVKASVLLGLGRGLEALQIVRETLASRPLAYGAIRSCLSDCELLEGAPEADECAILLRAAVARLREHGGG